MATRAKVVTKASPREKKANGRPLKLSADASTLKIMIGLGQIQATTKECAAVLGVTEPTYLKFKTDHPEVAEAYAAGSGQGLASLRRRQFRAANDGNATMLIWLGKQYLGQVDKQELLHGSDPSNPQTMRVVHNLDPASAKLIAELVK